MMTFIYGFCETLFTSTEVKPLGDSTDFPNSPFDVEEKINALRCSIYYSERE
ncbi:MAG: hypothetical protein P8M21_12080 [Halioglobus sp.]|nr:hypothetical protein [Halioglobus sp.]